MAAFLPDEVQAAAAVAILRRAAAEGASVPGHWRLETINALLVAERRRRIGPSEATSAIRELLALPFVVDGETAGRAGTATFALARRHGLTLYDAIYLELALRLGADLATFDAALARAATAEGVPLAS